MALTEEQKKARAAKAAATRKKKIEATAKAMGMDLKRKKVRKSRVMSPEQKAAAVERLRKAREAKGPSTNSQYHSSVVGLPDSDPLSLVKVKEWIKKTQQELEAMKNWDRSTDAVQRSHYHNAETYLYNLKQYIQHGVWLDYNFGESKEFVMVRRSLKGYPSYDIDGNVKRNVGTFYDDLGLIWTKEMDQRDRESR